MRCESDEVKFLINAVEKELQNLLEFLSKTLPRTQQFADSDINSYLEERNKHCEEYENRITFVMVKKAEKMNSLRRTSFAFTNRINN